jgi:hypothetical protein
MIFSWLMCTEILAILGIMYHTIAPFVYHKSSRILFYVTGYALLTATAYVFELPLLLTFLERYVPTLLIIYLLSPKMAASQDNVSILPSTKTALTQSNQIDTVISTIMHIGLNNTINQRTTFFLLEGRRPLDAVLHSSLPLNIPLNKDVLSSLCNSSLYNPDQMIHISHTGILKGINGAWQNKEQSALSSYAQSVNDIFNTAAVGITKTYDACLLYNNPIDRLWTCIVEDSIFVGLSAVAASRMLKKHLLFLQKTRSHNKQEKKNTSQQLNANTP